MSAIYLESTDEKLSIQMINFSSKVGAVATTFGLTPAEVASILADAIYFSWAVVNYKKVETNKKDWTTFKSILKKPAINVTSNPAPVAPTLDVAPTAVAPGVVYRFTTVVNRIKAHPAYSTAIGQNLGIESLNSGTTNKDTAKPIIKAILRGGKVDLVWKKGKFSGIVIEKDSGAGYVMLDKDFQPDFTDATPLPAPGQSALWKYRASYLLKDNKVGVWSDEVSITVTG
jgi:hypothetical protein